jgi:hypothetical protein
MQICIWLTKTYVAEMPNWLTADLSILHYCSDNNLPHNMCIIINSVGLQYCMFIILNFKLFSLVWHQIVSYSIPISTWTHSCNQFLHSWSWCLTFTLKESLTSYDPNVMYFTTLWTYLISTKYLLSTMLVVDLQQLEMSMLWKFPLEWIHCQAVRRKYYILYGHTDGKWKYKS